MLLQAFDENAWTHVEKSRKMLNTTSLAKMSATNEFAFFGFGEKIVLCELFGFGFENAWGRCCVVLCRGLRRWAKLQAGCTQRVVKYVRYGVEQRFEKSGIVHFCGRELDDGLVTSPVKGACRNRGREEGFYLDDFDSAVVERFAGDMA